MSEVVTRRTLSIVLYNQHTGLQQIHATKTRTPPGTPVRAHNTLIPRVTNTDTQYHTVLLLKNKLDALLALEAELLAVHRLRQTELNCHCAVPSQDLERTCANLLSDPRSNSARRMILWLPHTQCCA